MAYDPFGSGQPQFVFNTAQNQGAHEVIPAQVVVEGGAVLVAEFSDASSFPNPVRAGTLSYSQGQVTLDLNAADVNKVRSGFFRILATNVLGKTYLVASGRTQFTAGRAQDLANVATSGDYNDLVNKPVINADGSVTIGVTETVMDDAIATHIATAVQAHVVAPAPHPVYDDMPSLNILFENGLM